MRSQDIATSNSLTDLRERLKIEHEAVAGALRTSLHHAMAAGDLLTEAKAQLKHGQWLPWLKSCGVTERSAQRYIRLARNRTVIEANPTPMSDLGVSGALAMLVVPRQSDHTNFDADLEVHMADLTTEKAFNFWADIVAPDEQHRVQKALLAEVMAAMDRIGVVLKKRPDLDSESEEFSDQMVAICAELTPMHAAEMGLSVDDLRRLLAAVDDLKAQRAPLHTIVGLILKTTADHEHTTSTAVTALRSKLRDIAVAWLQHVEAV